jgi:hypothetical protein
MRLSEVGIMMSAIEVAAVVASALSQSWSSQRITRVQLREQLVQPENAG